MCRYHLSSSSAMILSLTVNIKKIYPSIASSNHCISRMQNYPKMTELYANPKLITGLCELEWLPLRKKLIEYSDNHLERLQKYINGQNCEIKTSADELGLNITQLYFQFLNILTFQSTRLCKDLIVKMIGSYPFAFGSSGAAEAPRPGRPLKTQSRVLNQAAGVRFLRNSVKAGKSLWQANKHHLTRLQLQGENSVLQRPVFMFVLCCTFCPHHRVIRVPPKGISCQRLA